MGTKALAAAIVITIALLGSLLVWTILAQNRNRSSIDSLSARMSALEEENQALSRRLEEREEGTGISMEQSAANRSKKLPAQGGTASTTPGAPETDNQNINEIKSDLREELASLVEKEQDAAHNKRREERMERWRNGILLSMNDFAEDQEVPQDVVERIQPMLEESMNRRLALHDDMEAQNISFYEFRQESRKATEEMEARIEEMLSEEQFLAFIEAFPSRF